MIYTLGESLMDIIIQEGGRAVVRAGGALLNVAVSLSRAGKKVTMMTEIGDDHLGTLLTDFLAENGVNTSLITRYPAGKTSLAVATLDKNGKPSYSFYKAYPRERTLRQPPEFQKGDVLIFGSMYSCDRDIKDYINTCLEHAKKEGALIVYDPNIRKNNHSGVSEMVYSNLAAADIVKGSDEDFEAVFGTGSVQEFYEKFRQMNNKAVFVITLGDKGSKASYRKMNISVPAYDVQIVSTIGAGDAFTAGIVNALVDMGLTNPDEIKKYHLQKMLEVGAEFSSVVGGTMDNYIPRR